MQEKKSWLQYFLNGHLGISTFAGMDLEKSTPPSPPKNGAESGFTRGPTSRRQHQLERRNGMGPNKHRIMASPTAAAAGKRVVSYCNYSVNKSSLLGK